MSGAYVTIDRIPLLIPTTPVAIDIIPAGFSERPLPGGGMVVFEEMTPPTILLRFGLPGLVEDAQRILEKIRGAYGYHLLGIQDLSCDRIEYFNVYIPRLPRNAQELGGGGKLDFGNIDLPCKVLDPWPKLAVIEFPVRGTIVLGDGAHKWNPPAPGRVWTITGGIRSSGSPGGQTRIQIAQGTTDFLATPGDFLAGGLNIPALLTNAVLVSNTQFAVGSDPLRLDVDALPISSDSADMVVTLWCLLYSIT